MVRGGKINLKALIPKKFGGPYTNIYNLLLSDPRNIEFFISNRKPLWEWIAGNNPDKIMEIGMGYGLNALCMVSFAGNSEYYCFDELADKYKFEGVYKLLKELENVHFFAGDSRETLPRNVEKLPKMDLIFIDGQHNYEVVENDWKYSKKLIHKNSIVWFHDYEAEGVKKLVNEIQGFEKRIVEPKVGPAFAILEGR